MKRNLRRSLGLAFVTATWLVLSTWVVLGDSPLAPVTPGTSATQEPPPSRTLWDRFSDSASHLLHLNEPDSPRAALYHAATRLGVPAWHQAGQRGKGVKIAILDSGFRGYQGALGKVLPAAVKVRSFRRDGRLDARNSQHGILCAEVIHHLAPDAELLFANWEPENPAQFLEALRWARREGAGIISCAIIMPTWSDGEGGGPVHRHLKALLGAGDRPGDGLLFASAGNTALRHWGGPFVPGKDGWHQWSRGRVDNAIRPLSSDRISVELAGPGNAACELVVRDTTLGREVGRARSVAVNGYFSAAVRFLPAAGHHYAVRLRRLDGGSGGRFHLTVLGGKLSAATRPGSIPFPGDGDEAVAVAAVDARGRRFGYSSCGPNGTAPKPDLAAVVPFPSLWRPEQPFAGTSAAAPQAAALAALLWSRHPEWTARQVRAALEKAAWPTREKHCTEAGHGVVRLPAPRR